MRLHPSYPISNIDKNKLCLVADSEILDTHKLNVWVSRNVYCDHDVVLALCNLHDVSLCGRGSESHQQTRMNYQWVQGRVRLDGCAACSGQKTSRRGLEV